MIGSVILVGWVDPIAGCWGAVHSGDRQARLFEESDCAVRLVVGFVSSCAAGGSIFIQLCAVLYRAQDSPGVFRHSYSSGEISVGSPESIFLVLLTALTIKHQLSRSTAFTTLMKHFRPVDLLFAWAFVCVDSAPPTPSGKLNIETTFKPATCPISSRNGDRLASVIYSLHYPCLQAEVSCT